MPAQQNQGQGQESDEGAWDEDGPGVTVYAAAISVGDSPTFAGERAVCVEAFCLLDEEKEQGEGAGAGAGENVTSPSQPSPLQQDPTPAAIDPSNPRWLDLYGRRVTVSFGHCLRGMVQFTGEHWLRDLLLQMGRDCARARELCARGWGLGALEGLLGEGEGEGAV